MFRVGDRTDWTPARANEPTYDFIDRSATPFFEEVRRLLQEWLAHVPEEHRAGPIGNARSNNHGFYSAFWELYLHEVYTTSGYSVTIHPDVSGTSRHPDFLVERGDDRFYVEAIKVGEDQAEVAQDRRLADVYAVLERLEAGRFSVSVTANLVGNHPLATRKLRPELLRWLESLDPDTVTRDAERYPGAGLDRLPNFPWEDDGWLLEFHALPRKVDAPVEGTHLLGMRGPGEAVIVDNTSGLLRALATKSNRYGQLDAPLVVAVLSNTTYPTRDYDVETALYGLSSRRPTEAAAHADELMEGGHWLTRSG